MKKSIAVLLLAAVMLSMCVFCSADEPELTIPVTISPDESYKQINPLTGYRYTDEEDYERRIIAVSINNHRDALPQAGLIGADMVVEMETEGGITRLMALYTDIEKVERIGSVRSLRDQFIEFVAPLNAYIVHIGISVVATDILNTRRVDNLNGDYISAPFEFDDARYATGVNYEHCTFLYPDRLIDTLEDRDAEIANGIYTPKFADFISPDEMPVILSGGDAAEVSFKFSAYGDRSMEYDAATGEYLMSQYGEPSMDLNFNKQWSVENVFILFAPMGGHPNVDKLVSVDYALGGTGYYINGGRYEEITWKKGNFDAPFKFYTADGEELTCNPGTAYVAVVRDTMEDTLEIK